MDERNRRRQQSVLDVQGEDLNAIVNERNIFSRDIINISSDDESADGDEFSPSQPHTQTNTGNTNQSGGALNLLSLAEGLSPNNHPDHGRVHGGRVTRPKERKAKSRRRNRQNVSERIGNRGDPLQPIEEHRGQRHQLPHVLVPQNRAARSGPGQIPQFQRGALIDGRYSVRSLNAKGPLCGYPLEQDTPYYLPFVLQITILRSIQTVLEFMCYRFVQKWLPRMLNANKWDCPDAIELNLWWRVLDGCTIPAEAIKAPKNSSLAKIFDRIQHIRHLAVHRIPSVSIQTIQAMVTDALDLAVVLKDDSFVPKLRLWMEKLDYFLKVIRAARGDLDRARKLDSINTEKQKNMDDQDKLHQDINDLENQIRKKQQEINALKGEYDGHCAKENELIANGRLSNVVQEAELGNSKWTDDCFTIDLDRNAPDVRPVEIHSDNIIHLQTVGIKPWVPTTNSGSRVVETHVNLSNGRHTPILNNTFSPSPGPNGMPRMGVFRAASTPGRVARPPGINGPADASNAGSIAGIPGLGQVAGASNLGSVAGIPGLGQTASSGPVLRSNDRQPMHLTAGIVDLTGPSDDDAMLE
ncbi:hypothetical protein NHQ30_009410 [Ciborinia camelliae]|nr:hypothetical protein NHQ30_009410 [Ciborinia camelliae]